MSGWIGVDLDGTLAEYGKWNSDEIGTPVPAMVERIKSWLATGQEVRIMTARVSADQANNSYQRGLIINWCLKHLGQELPVTCRKDFAMIELWDDRAVGVEMNTGKITSGQPGWQDGYDTAKRQAAGIAQWAESVQENEYGAANSGGAAYAKTAIENMTPESREQPPVTNRNGLIQQIMLIHDSLVAMTTDTDRLTALAVLCGGICKQCGRVTNGEICDHGD